MLKLSGIPIRPDPTMAVPVLLLLLAGVEGTGIADAAMAVITLFSLILLHELAHALVARRLGYRPIRILLHAFGGLLTLDREAERPRDEILISLAGPALNLLLFGLAVMLPVPDRAVPAAPSGMPDLGQAQQYFILFNLLLGLFNLLPIFPMDGGRVLRALLSLRYPRLRATTLVVWLGLPVAILCSVIAIRFGAYMVPLLFTFMAISGFAELAMIREALPAQDPTNPPSDAESGENR